jgi:hypothetical protein
MSSQASSSPSMGLQLDLTSSLFLVAFLLVFCVFFFAVVTLFEGLLRAIILVFPYRDIPVTDFLGILLGKRKKTPLQAG